MAPSAAEEAAFMAQLLQGLDNTLSFPTNCAPQSSLPNHDLDMAAFLEGSENWDLGDLTPSPVIPAKGLPMVVMV